MRGKNQKNTHKWPLYQMNGLLHNTLIDQILPSEVLLNPGKSSSACNFPKDFSKIDLAI